MKWSILSIFMMLSTVHRASGKSTGKFKISQRQVPYYLPPNAYPDLYGPSGTFGIDDGMHGVPYPEGLGRRWIGGNDEKRQKVGGWWGRRDATGGNEELKEHDQGKSPKVGGWWGRRDTTGGNEELKEHDQAKRQKVGGWWGRRDETGGNEELKEHDQAKKQKVGGWWGRP